MSSLGAIFSMRPFTTRFFFRNSLSRLSNSSILLSLFGTPPQPTWCKSHRRASGWTSSVVNRDRDSQTLWDCYNRKSSDLTSTSSTSVTALAPQRGLLSESCRIKDEGGARVSVTVRSNCGFRFGPLPLASEPYSPTLIQKLFDHWFIGSPKQKRIKTGCQFCRKTCHPSAS